MRYTNRLGLVVLSAAAASHSAAAQGDFYVFGALGRTDAEVSLGRQARADDDNGGFALGGGYRFSDRFSIEAAYQGFGSYAAETDCPPGFFCLVVPLRTTVDVAAFSASLVGSFGISDRLDGYGKLGITHWDVEFDGISSAFDESDQDLHYGVGLRWSLADHWKVFAEYAATELDLDTVTMGVRYDF